jgi:hypothetical protein
LGAKGRPGPDRTDQYHLTIESRHGVGDGLGQLAQWDEHGPGDVTLLEFDRLADVDDHNVIQAVRNLMRQHLRDTVIMQVGHWSASMS